MTTVTDTDNIYTTIYTDCTKQNCKQKEITITGQLGKHIRIDELSLSLCSADSGATATVTVTVEVAGTEKTLITWPETKTDYQAKDVKPVFLVDAGKDAIIRWYLKTTDPAHRAKIELVSYSYSFVDVPAPVPVPVDNPCVIVITCSSESDATTLLATLKTSTQDAVMYKQM